MFKKFERKKKTTELDKEITRLLKDLADERTYTDDYSTILDYVERVIALKEKEKPKQVSRDTMALVVGNLLGIFLIVAYEQKHVMRSKGIGLIVKPK